MRIELTAPLRDLANSILLGVQMLEDTTPHSSWKDWCLDDYLAEVNTAMQEADQVLAATVSDFREPMIP